MMRYLYRVTLVALLAVPTIARAQEFIPYEGRETIRQGEGGGKKTVDGVDFWSDGSPSRKFKLVGYVTDRRHKTGLIGKFSMNSLESDIARVARSNGGDAVILMRSEAETVGAVGNSNVYGNSGFAVTRGVQKQNSKFAVVKYLSEAEQVNPPAARPASPASQ
jgi:hypothetical protein